MFFTSTVLSAILFAASGASAAPSHVAPQQLDVITPPITYPTAGVVLPVGTTHNVTWDTSSIPADKANTTGLLLLGQQTDDSENLDIGHPLASGFPITAGFAAITIPNKANATNYIIVLFGDSGNISPQFTITGGSA